MMENDSTKQRFEKDLTGWVRPSKVENDPSLWGSKGVLPHGVNQGGIGDCWFMAAGAAIAEYPERIKSIFTNTAYSKKGIF